MEGGVDRNISTSNLHAFVQQISKTLAIEAFVCRCRHTSLELHACVYIVPRFRWRTLVVSKGTCPDSALHVAHGRRPHWLHSALAKTKQAAEKVGILSFGYLFRLLCVM